MLALKSCPLGYQGNMYRPCFSNGKWGSVDYSECRLEHLGRMRHMVRHCNLSNKVLHFILRNYHWATGAVPGSMNLSGPLREEK
ncbi:hypothetical protein CEXT_192381 [Caerostris extrusa]|uniref:G-protein coupled receptors family 2 profile 1 domain-containing protein n=1 Tax=Caerostris extrusa TaxID=172846 RepID=A0AAV4VM45_CAEEX|nr:hypothetical protein CEXT_192381 [Caerostris extrusa]